MPHSSGGGSRHGGSHHSSSHRSSSSGSRSRVSKNYYSGSRRYVYYRHGRPNYFYSTSDPRKFFTFSRFLGLLIYLPMFAISLWAMGMRVGRHFKEYDTTVVISDKANVISSGSETEISDAFKAFYEKTGVTPALMTVNNEDWYDSYGNLEDYAYDLYLQQFDDEMHWLIVYSEPENPIPGDNDWYWEGMQGNDTDFVLTSDITSDFNANLELNLLDETTSVGDDIAYSIKSITAKAKKPGLRVIISEASPMLIMIAFLLFHAYFVLGLGDLKYRKAQPCPEISSTPLNETTPQNQPPKQLICDYCGTYYTEGDTVCPSCGAPTAYKYFDS